MALSRRDFLVGSVVALGAAAMGERVSRARDGQKYEVESTNTAPTYEIYALKWAGPVPRKLAVVLWWEDWNKDTEMNYYVWAIKGKDEIIVVDTGSYLSLADERRLTHYVNPIEMLASFGASKTNVKKVIITHCHWDHLAGIEMFSQAFPEAVFYIQKKEFDFWTKNPIAKRAPFAKVTVEKSIRAISQMEGTPRLRLISGDAKIMPGIELMLTPGHTIGLQAVAVNTVKGTAIVASDCGFVRESFEQDIPNSVITDLVAWMGSFDKLRAKASSIDLIFPGHDVRMLNDSPKVAETVARLV